MVRHRTPSDALTAVRQPRTKDPNQDPPVQGNSANARSLPAFSIPDLCGYTQVWSPSGVPTPGSPASAPPRPGCRAARPVWAVTAGRHRSLTPERSLPAFLMAPARRSPPFPREGSRPPRASRLPTPTPNLSARSAWTMLSARRRTERVRNRPPACSPIPHPHAPEWGFRPRPGYHPSPDASGDRGFSDHRTASTGAVAFV